MRKAEPVRIGEVLKEFIRNSPRLSRLLLDSRAIAAWKEVVSPYTASRTTRVSVYRGKMTVHIDSPALRHEIFMRRTELIGKINGIVGQEVIHAIYVR